MPKRYTQDEWIELAKERHGDLYDYSKVKYVNSKTPITVICPVHGEISIKPDLHVKGSGCPHCGVVLRNTGRASTSITRMTKESFIQRAKEVHGDKYDYSLVDFKNMITKVTLICPEHGKFEIQPSKHCNRGQGCASCAGTKKKTTQQFIQEVTKIHKGLYDYSQLEYINDSSPVTIICKRHGPFNQRANDHKNGAGCPVCSSGGSSKSEYNLRRWIETTFRVDCVSGLRPSWLIPRSYKNPCELDIFIPEWNLAIEYNGSATHQSTAKTSTKFIRNMSKPPTYHEDKYNLCKEHGIDLIHIFEFENMDKWQRKLSNYFHDRDKYEIVFKSEKRTFEDLEFYGKTCIKLKY